ncbi:MAG TPA: cytochrome c [Planctomycetaceae bacterium]|nr:cytochrome c [Planctomycetaceae bacterium]
MRVSTVFLIAALTVSLSLTATAAETASPTFSKDIAPIIFKNCTSCHRPGEAAPFALQSYADVKKRGELIEHVVSTKLMPPWKAAPADVPFKRERRLSDDDISLITRWVKAGMSEGDRRDLPPLPEFPKGWQLGAPDLILKMPEAFTVPAEGPDIYRNFVVQTNLAEERWVRAIEFRPGAPAVVHHTLFFVETSGRARQLDAADPQPGFRGGMGALIQLRGKDSGPMKLMSGRPQRGAGASLSGDGGPLNETSFGSLGGWALGAQPHELPDGLAFHLPAGADLILATHFHPSGKVEREASTIGLYFADSPPKQRFTGIQLPPAFGALKGIDIPAGAKEYVIEDSFELPIDVKAFGVGAHAHYLGKSMTLTATLPTGEKKTLLSIPDWDFAWQEQYDFADFVPLPKGTRLHSRITYDNSADNPRNPTQPPQRVRFGEESTNEMGSITLTVIAADESDMPRLQAAYRDHFRESFRKAPLLKLLQSRLPLK